MYVYQCGRSFDPQDKYLQTSHFQEHNSVL